MEPDRSRLGRLVRERRAALRLTQRQAAVAADISNQTWINVEQGEPVKDHTLAGVDRALAWEPGSCQKVLQGGDPVEAAQAAVRPPHFSLADEVADLRQRLEVLERELQGERNDR